MSSSLTTVTAFVQVAPPAEVWAEALAVARDVVLTLAAAVGAWVAWRGLSTWKAQLTGHTEYDLARRLLRTFYRYRDAIAWVRKPSMSIGEMLEDIPLDDDPIPTPEWLYEGTSRAYQRRWERVAGVRADLYPELLEAEVVWGPKVSELARPLFALENELSLAIEDELAVRKPGASSDEVAHLVEHDQSTSRHRILYARPGREEDVFGASFQSALDRVAEELRPHLARMPDKPASDAVRSRASG